MHRFSIAALLCLLGSFPTFIWAQTDPPKAAGGSPRVNLIAMGDWGSGGAAQKDVALTMAKQIAARGVAFDGAVLAGDNFYGKLTSINDKRWQRDFEAMYAPPAFAFPFFAVAGNHDLEAKKLAVEMNYARENPTSRWKFPARWYRVDLPAGSPKCRRSSSAGSSRAASLSRACTTTAAST